MLDAKVCISILNLDIL